MPFKPDYGLRLVDEGVSEAVEHFFYEFRLYNLYVLDLGQYSTMVELPYAGETHALSLDFNEAQFREILAKASETLRTHIMEEIATDPSRPRRIDFDGEIAFGVRARLGTLQTVQRESFVPLVAQEIFL